LFRLRVQNDNCCTSLLVPGGTFNRDNDPNYPATMSDFYLGDSPMIPGLPLSRTGKYGMSAHAAALTSGKQSSFP
jgi:hypothetical protein